MNFVTFIGGILRAARLCSSRPVAQLSLLVTIVVCLAGCSDQVQLPSPEQMYEFHKAGPVPLTVDKDRLVKAKIGGGPYRVVAGDVIELTIPSILHVLTAQDPVAGETNTPYICRVHDNGTITLPVVEQMQVAGKTLSQIESDIVTAYYPKYAATSPSVFARVREYRTLKVSISGAVKNPGIYELRTDQMSLVGLLMEAGGIIDEGAVCVRISHSDNSGSGLLEAHNDKPMRISGQFGTTADSQDDIFKTSTSDVNIIFRRRGNTTSTFGQIQIIDSEGNVLLAEHLDIAQGAERRVLLRKLAVKRPWASTAETEEKLRTLAESIGSGDRITRNSSYSDLTTTPFLLSSQSDIKDQASHDYSGKSSAENDPLYKDMEETNRQLIELLKVEENPMVQQEDAPLILPIEGLNIPFADVVLRDGDRVMVERLEQPLFTVLGLVNRPGNFPYPPDVKYNLMQALGFAGGLDKSADPRYATVYRLTPEDEIISAVFQVVKVKDGSKLIDALNATVKPGDIVFVEHTPRTRTKVFLESVFRINLGTYIRLEDAWN